MRVRLNILVRVRVPRRGVPQGRARSQLVTKYVKKGGVRVLNHGHIYTATNNAPRSTARIPFFDHSPPQLYIAFQRGCMHAIRNNADNIRSSHVRRQFSRATMPIQRLCVLHHH